MTRKVIVSLVVIVILGTFLRLWQLGTIPPSLDWDEASLGWNAYSLLKTGTDEYGASHPIAIRSFNDYKPAGYVYTLLPIIALFGPTEIAIRLVSALAGIGSIVALFFVIKQLTQNDKLSLIGSLLFALSPWSIIFSRAAFEANLALFGVVAGIALFLLSHKHLKIPMLILSLVCFWGAFYSYHSTKLFVPLIFIALIVFYWRQLFSKAKVLSVVLVVIFFLGLIPAAKSSLLPTSGGARFSTVSIFSESAYKMEREAEKRQEEMAINKGDLIGKIFHHRLMFYPRQYISNYLSHFDIRFIFLESDLNNRHRAPDIGLLLLWQLPFLLAGLWFVLKNQMPGRWFVFAWLLLAPLASAVAAPSPHAIRSLLILPPLTIISAYGVMVLLSRRTLVIAAVSLALTLNFYYFAHQYFVHGPVEFAGDWQYGYKQMVEQVAQLHGQYKEVYVTNFYDQPYIYFLLYGTKDPSLKNDGTLGQVMGNYRFTDFRIMSPVDKESLPKDALYVVAPGDDTQLQVIKYVIKDQLGKPIFYIGQNVSLLGWGKMP